MLPNDNVSMFVGHLDHVLIVYSLMEHVTWKSTEAMELCGSSEGQGRGGSEDQIDLSCLLQELLLCCRDRQEVRPEDQGTQKKVDSFTAGTQTRASRARESSVTHKSAITDHVVEENHVIDWDKAKVSHSDRPDG